MCPRPFIRVCVLSFTLFAHFSFTCDVYRHIIIMMRCLLFAWTFISYNSFFLSLSRSLSFSVWWCDETISHSRHAICKIDLVFIADITRKKNAPQAGNTYAAIQYTRVNTFNSQNVTTFRSCVDWSDGMEKKQGVFDGELGKNDNNLTPSLSLSLSCTIGDFIRLAVLHLHN